MSVTGLLESLCAEPTVAPSPELARAGVTTLLSDPEWSVLAPWVRLRLRELEADACLAPALWAALVRSADAGVALSLGRRLLCRQLARRAEALDLPLMTLKGIALTGWVYPWGRRETAPILTCWSARRSIASRQGAGRDRRRARPVRPSKPTARAGL